LKRLINRTSSQSLFDKNNTLNVNTPILLNSSNKQLTIPYSNNTSPNETVKEESFVSNNSSNNNDNQYLSIPAMSNSTASFTISNKLDDSKVTISDNNKSDRKSKSFFKFKINKSKSPKKQ
jgi:hypothetical protein